MSTDKNSNIYDLMRNWFDFCFENPEKINTNHSALYFFILSHCNRLGWKNKFGLPTTMTMEAIGIKSYNTYIKTFKELDSFGFIKVLQKSSNQYSSNIIALSKFDKATSKQHESNSKALDKATLKQVQKQHESNCSVDIPIQQYNNTTINQHTNTLENIIKKKSDFAETLKPFLETYGKDFLNEFYEYWTEPNKSNTKMRFELQKTWSIDLRLKTWAKNDKNFKLKTNSNHGSTSTKLTATEKTDKLKRDFAEKFINEIQHGTDIAPSEDGGYAVVQ